MIRRILEMTLLVLLIGLLVIFSFANLEFKSDLIIWPGVMINDQPVPVYIVIGLGIGALLAFIIASFDIMRKSFEVHHLKRKIKEQEEEINTLRNIPLSEENKEPESSVPIS